MDLHSIDRPLHAGEGASLLSVLSTATRPVGVTIAGVDPNRAPHYDRCDGLASSFSEKLEDLSTQSHCDGLSTTTTGSTTTIALAAAPATSDGEDPHPLHPSNSHLATLAIPAQLAARVTALNFGPMSDKCTDPAKHVNNKSIRVDYGVPLLRHRLSPRRRRHSSARNRAATLTALSMIAAAEGTIMAV